MAMETQDIIKRSATNPITPAPRARDHKAEVAKLIDVSSCVGCKACQVPAPNGMTSAMTWGTASGCTITRRILAPNPGR